MADQFASLPHLVGKITNIDGREAQRSLKSIQAESVRRQTLFSQASTPENPINSIGRYIHLRRTAPERAPVALPHLIIIVDEFAELKTTYPDFMQELVSAARIGRSLGIHLILATQKPSGVVDDQIWSNSNFRLCLRVQTREDSKEVLKTPLAAEIREPGRAYLQVGNNEIFELFQSAYSGAKLQTDGGHGNCFRLYEVNPWGKQQVVFDNRPKVREDSQRTELTALVEHISRYCLENDVPTPAQVCLPPLPESLRLCDVLGERPAGGVAATLGLLDDPERHEQPPLHLDLTESNTFLLGASQTGKSMLLMTAITSIAMHYTPREVNIYLLDGGNSMPRALESSRIVGGVCYREEEERIGNLINLLKREIGRRRRRFVECSVGGFKAYQEAGHDDLPAIVIMLDNAVSVREYCEPLFDQLMFLSREGNGAGIYFMISSTQYAVVPSKVMIGFGTKLALNCNDPGEYSNLFDRCRIQPLDRPGRGLVMINKRILEFQTAWFADGVNEQERNEAMRARFMERNEEYGGCCARPIPMVPEIIPAPEMFALAKAAPKYHLPIGMNYEGVEPVYLDLTEQWVLPLVGRQQSGRTNFIRTVMDMIQATTLKNRTDCYIADSPNRPLDYCRRDYGFVREYTVDSGEALGYIAQIAAELERRQQAMVEAGGAVAEAEFLDRLPLLLLAIDNADFVAMASADKETMAQIATIKKLSRYRALLLLNVENLSPISMHTPELAKRVAADKNGLIFDDLGSSVLFSVPPKTVNQYSKPVRVGDCYIYKNGGVVEKVHTALSTAS